MNARYNILIATVLMSTCGLLYAQALTAQPAQTEVTGYIEQNNGLVLQCDDGKSYVLELSDSYTYMDETGLYPPDEQGKIAAYCFGDQCRYRCVGTVRTTAEMAKGKQFDGEQAVVLPGMEKNYLNVTHIVLVQAE